MNIMKICYVICDIIIIIFKSWINENVNELIWFGMVILIVFWFVEVWKINNLIRYFYVILKFFDI